MLSELFEVLGQLLLVALIASMAIVPWLMDLPLPVTRRIDDGRNDRDRRNRRTSRGADLRTVRRLADVPALVRENRQTRQPSARRVTFRVAASPSRPTPGRATPPAHRHAWHGSARALLAPSLHP